MSRLNTSESFAMSNYIVAFVSLFIAIFFGIETRKLAMIANELSATSVQNIKPIQRYYTDAWAL